jgi:hypothetical protein
MTYILQVDFPYQGPWADEMGEAMNDLAHSIAKESGLIWKIWTVNESTNEAGGIYLFEDADNAKRYLAMHTARLRQFGVPHVNGKLLEVHQALSMIDRGPIQ